MGTPVHLGLEMVLLSANHHILQAFYASSFYFISSETVSMICARLFVSKAAIERRHYFYFHSRMLHRRDRCLDVSCA